MCASPRETTTTQRTWTTSTANRGHAATNSPISNSKESQTFLRFLGFFFLLFYLSRLPNCFFSPSERIRPKGRKGGRNGEWSWRRQAAPGKHLAADGCKTATSPHCDTSVKAADGFCPPTCPRPCYTPVCVRVALTNPFGSVTTFFRLNSVLARRPPTLPGFDTHRWNSSDGILHSVKLLLKQTKATEPKWKLQSKYSDSSFSCPEPQTQSTWKQLPTRGMEVKTKTRLCWYLLRRRTATQWGSHYSTKNSYREWKYVD